MATPESSDSNSHAENDQTKRLQSIDASLLKLQKGLAAIETSLTDIRPLAIRERNSHTLEIWRTEILPVNIHDPSQQHFRAFLNPSPLRFDELLLGESPWNSASYTHAFPKLSSFIANATLDEHSREHSRARVIINEKYDSGKCISYHVKGKTVDHTLLWARVATRLSPATPLNTNLPTANHANMTVLALERVVQVTDISPLVAVMLLASSPR